jgi:hypothetical protein
VADNTFPLLIQACLTRRESIISHWALFVFIYFSIVYAFAAGKIAFSLSATISGVMACMQALVWCWHFVLRQRRHAWGVITNSCPAVSGP